MKMNLIKRKINIQPTCPICKNKDETTLHRLVECPLIKQLWIISPLAIKIRELKANNFKEWMQRRFEIPNTTDKDRLWICERINNMMVHLETKE